MLGKASEIKIRSLNWWASLELGRPSLEEIIKEWLEKNPDLIILQIDYELTPSHKQAIILYKEAE